MLFFSEINSSDLGKIVGIRDEDDNLGQKLLDGETSFSFAHESFAMGLASLKQPGIPQPQRTGIRVLEVANESFSYLYEIYGDSGAQRFRDTGFLGDYESAFESILAVEEDPRHYTVQTLRIPALHIDALWLHDASVEDNDKFVPVRTIPGLEKARLYDRGQFFSPIKDAAAILDPGDDLSGG
jgi:hypothetical protein